MSHYVVAVFMDEKTTIEDLLEPFDENIEVEKYVYRTKKEQIDYGKEEIKYNLKMYKEYMKDKKKFRREHRLQCVRFVKKIPRMKKWDDEKIYKYSIRYYSSDEIGKNGEIYSTYNKDAKWDWYDIGGRWKNMLIDKYGNKTNSLMVKDIDWKAMQKEIEEYLIPYKEYIENSRCQKEELLKKYPNEEVYKNKKTKFSTYAALMPNGEWIEPGEMGWWGMSNASNEQLNEFYDNYEENILKKVDENWRLTIVDCHI